MLVIKSPKFTFTLFTYTLLALTLVEASSHSSGGVSRREHTNLKRFVKKRSPFPQTGKTNKESDLAANDKDIFDLPEVIGAGRNPDPSGSLSPSVSLSSSDSLSSSSSSASSSVPTSDSSSSSSSASSSSSSAAPSSSSSSTEAPTSTEPPAPSKSTVTVKSTAVAPQRTSTTNLQNGAASKTKSYVLTALIAVAASIGGIVILWTIFRKWKLGRSKQFDQRLQPIDWQPTTHEDDGIIPAHRRHSGASSFRRYGAASETSPASDYSHGTLQPLPDHDFTAGSNLAPVGGYADLSRGPSPQPQMLERSGASGYDAGLPLHHQGYGSQDAYGGTRY